MSYEVAFVVTVLAVIGVAGTAFGLGWLAHILWITRNQDKEPPVTKR